MVAPGGAEALPDYSYRQIMKSRMNNIHGRLLFAGIDLCGESRPFHRPPAFRWHRVYQNERVIAVGNTALGADGRFYKMLPIYNIGCISFS